MKKFFIPNYISQDFYSHINLQTEPYIFSFNRDRLISIFENQKQIIKILLENQNILFGNIEALRKVQTTDTEHNFNDIDSIKHDQSLDREKFSNKKVERPLESSKNYCQFRQKGPGSKKIKIIQTICQHEDQDIQNQCEIQENQENCLSEGAGQKQCQTKNIIKNYGKSILTFIRKKHLVTIKLLKAMNLDELQFYHKLENFKGKINSINDLKQFWTDEGNKFAKIFRILSNLYLTKYSLKHTFCSRVKNHAVHIKYRKRLLQILTNPGQFSCIKYF